MIAELYDGRRWRKSYRRNSEPRYVPQTSLRLLPPISDLFMHVTTVIFVSPIFFGLRLPESHWCGGEGLYCIAPADLGRST